MVTGTGSSVIMILGLGIGVRGSAAQGSRLVLPALGLLGGTIERITIHSMAKVSKCKTLHQSSIYR